MERKQALVAQARHRRIQRRQRLSEEGKGSMPVRLFQRRAAQALGLAAIDTDADRRIVTRGTAEGGMLTVERDEQNGRRSAPSPCLPGGLKCSARRLASGADHAHLEGILAITDVERFRVKLGLARERQWPGRPLRKKRSSDMQRQSLGRGT
jgi:hypothetical protein